MAVQKSALIQLVRAAQRERDPQKREELWKQVREAGLPNDATVITGEVIGKEAGNASGKK